MQKALALLEALTQVLVLDPQFVGLPLSALQLLLELVDPLQKLLLLSVDEPCALKLVDRSILAFDELIKLRR